MQKEVHESGRALLPTQRELTAFLSLYLHASFREKAALSEKGQGEGESLGPLEMPLFYNHLAYSLSLTKALSNCRMIKE